MITADDLASALIRHVIFHDVPQNRGDEGPTPQLSDDETAVDAAQKYHLKTKLVRVLSSSKAYPIEFLATTTSPVPPAVRQITAATFNPHQFVSTSHQLANYLFEQHNGAISPGLLCVIDAVVSGQPCLILMKLERERGAQLEMSGAPGHRTFAMSVLNDLVLTDGTRLFKCAMFIREINEHGEETFRASACDDQQNVFSSEDLAKFWMKFLGCRCVVEPRVATQRFFLSAVSFINSTVTEPIVKSDIYDHLQSQMKSRSRNFAPRTFAQEFVPEPYRRPFLDHLEAEHIPLAAFTKDVSDIQNSLKRRAFETTRGGIISVPEDMADIVEVRPRDILVKDTVSKVK